MRRYSAYQRGGSVRTSNRVLSSIFANAARKRYNRSQRGSGLLSIGKKVGRKLWKMATGPVGKKALNEVVLPLVNEQVVKRMG